MRAIVPLLLISSCYLVDAHSTLSAIIKNGVATFSCIRPLNDEFYTYPVQSLQWFNDGMNSNNYSCGFMPFAGQEAPSTCEVTAGETIGVGFTNTVEDETIPIMIQNHRGPITIYMARHDHGNGGLPQGQAWFKVFQLGLTAPIKEGDDPDATPWACPDNLYLDQGMVEMKHFGGSFHYGAQKFQIPADLPDGDYLIRTELITLQGNTPDSSAAGENRAQLYVGCAQVRVSGGGNGNPTDLVSFPGAYPKSHKAFSYVLWRDQFDTPYPYPGPQVYVAGSSPNPNPPPTNSPTPSPTNPPSPNPTPAPNPIPSPPTTQGPWTGPSSLDQDVKLNTGEDFADPTGNWRLLMQMDGNICMYDKDYAAVWCSGSNDLGSGDYYAIVESDGKFKIRDASKDGKLVWSTDNTNQGAGEPYVLHLQSDRNLLVVDGAGDPVWKAGTSLLVTSIHNPFNNGTQPVVSTTAVEAIASSANFVQVNVLFMILIAVAALL